MFQLNKTALMLGLTVSIAGLTACGGGNDSKTATKTNENSKKETTTETKAGSDELAEVQEITINNAAEPESLDPYHVGGVPGSNVVRQMFDGLTSTDVNGNTIPGVAESWETKDNKVWTFKLRDSKWSNGEPVTADDFVYAWRRGVDPKTAASYSNYLANARVLNAKEITEGKAKPETLGIKALDDKTLEVTLSESVPYFPDMLTYSVTKPVPRKVIEKYGDKWTNPENIVVNGAYKLAERKLNDKIVLEKNPEYYDKDKVVIDKVILLPIPKSTTDVTRYKAGEVDVTADDIPPEQFATLKQQLGNQVKVSPKLCSYYYEYNITKAPFDDKKVRLALSMALDRSIITDKVMKQGQTISYQMTPVATKGIKKFEPEWASWSMEKRLTEAKKLLNEAGYNKEHPLKFELLYNTNESHKKIAVAVGALWKESLGFVDISLVNQEWKTYLDNRKAGKFPMVRAAWCGDYNEPSAFLNVLKTKGSGNYGGYSSEVVDGLLEQTLQAGVDVEQRMKLYNQIEEQFNKDIPDIFMFHYVSPRLVKPYVKGFSDKDPLNNWQAKYWSIAKH